MNIGFENRVVAERVTGILANIGNPAKQLRELAQQERRLFSAQAGRRTRSLVIMDSNQVFASAIAPETLMARLKEARKQEKEASQ